MFSSIVHIGAHLCEEIENYLKISTGVIGWAEADPVLAKRALEVIKNANSNRNVLFNFFVSDLKKENVNLKIFNNDGASNSLYPPTRRIKKYWPELRVVGSTSVKTTTLEQIVNQLGLFGQNNLLVLDAQGHELNVLKSGEKSLALFREIRCEVSYEKLYRGAPKADSIIAYLQHHGFKILNANQGFHYEAIFIKT